MEITKVGQFGTQMTKFGLVNVYLVQEADGFTLVDTGLSGMEKAVFAEAARTGLPLKRILLTHAHVDHVGSLDALVKTGVAELAIGAREARMLPKKPAQDLSLEPGEVQCPVKGGFPGVDARPTHLLTDGELYGSLRAIATPGHTPGHFSYLDERDGTLYSGDALCTVRGNTRVTGWAPWYFPFPNMATWHRPTALESVRRLGKFDVRRVAAGHGRLVEGGESVAAAAEQARL